MIRWSLTATAVGASREQPVHDQLDVGVEDAGEVGASLARRRGRPVIQDDLDAAPVDRGDADRGLQRGDLLGQCAVGPVPSSALDAANPPRW